jgi:hypothetical protein
MVSVVKQRLPQQTEKAFQAQVLDLARLNHWHAYHTRDSRGSHPGYPDLHFWGHGRSFFAELKAERGYLSLDQRRVIAQLRAAGVDVHVWKPSDWLEIVAELTQHRTVPNVAEPP